jgi:hypothetical protein
MVGYMALEEQVEKDFSLARRKALPGRHKAATSGERRAPACEC